MIFHHLLSQKKKKKEYISLKFRNGNEINKIKSYLFMKKKKKKKKKKIMIVLEHSQPTG
jgi:hypothetical protein